MERCIDPLLLVTDNEQFVTPAAWPLIILPALAQAALANERERGAPRAAPLQMPLSGPQRSFCNHGLEPDRSPPKGIRSIFLRHNAPDRIIPGLRR
jgi:hypothetical protein